MGRVGPFGFAVKGFMGGAAGMDAEKPDHASAIGMGSRMIAPFGHDERNWG